MPAPDDDATDRPGDGEDSTAGSRCSVCGGPTVSGAVGLTLLGSPKFTYKVRHLEVSVPLQALLCEDCGEVRFRAPDPGRIRLAREGLAKAGLRQLASTWRVPPRPATPPPAEPNGRTGGA